MVFSIQQKLIFIYLTSIVSSVEISSQTTLSEISNASVLRVRDPEGESRM
jgi:hypothetical protein